MQRLKSSIHVSSETFERNRQGMLGGIERLRAELKKSTEGGGPKYAERHIARGKLLPRDRVELLLDPGSYFLELAPLAGIGMKDEAPGAGLIGGIGLVSGVECMIICNESTLKGGASTEMGVRKHQRFSDIALQNGLPTISLVESAGADLPNQSKVFIPGGREFREISRRSKSRLPTISVVFGSSTAGGAYFPGMSDYVVMVKDQAKVFLAGPPLVKMATGEITDDETLGGAHMHCAKSGLGDFLANDEISALKIARSIIESLNWKKPIFKKAASFEDPFYNPEELLGIASWDLKVPFDSREVIARIVDGSNFEEFKPLYGPTLVTGFAQLHGYPLGILANNGVLMSESAAKGTQFISLCNQQNIPLLFLQNITGFIVGKEYEQQGIIRNGAKLINAVSNSTVPAITIMMGGSYGAGNYAMCGRAYDPRFLFSWPNHRIAVMGGKQLAGVMEIIKREASEKSGTPVDEKELAIVRQAIESQIEKESDPYFATARLWDDGIIDPRHTRSVIAIALSAALNRPVEGTMEWGVFRH